MSFPMNTSPYGKSQNDSGNFLSNSFTTMNPTAAFYNNRNNGGIAQRGWEALFGRPERNYQQSLLGPEQQQNYQQLLSAGRGPGAGGAFGDVSDYYRNNLSNNSADFDAFAAPEMRRFREQTVPDLAEQFAGMGSGGLSSSGFRNAAVNAGSDLSERLGAIRAQIRQQSAQGLQGIGQLGLGNYNENIHRPETFGLLGNVAEGVGKAGGSYLTGKIPGLR